MPGLRTYWHTLRHLRPIQLYGRAYMRLWQPRIDQRPAPAVRPVRGRGWVLPAQRRQSMVGPERFLFLNEPHDLGDHGWDDPAIEKLWRYNLHYFDDLNAAGCEFRQEWHRALLVRWVVENPPPTGTGWEPYPTSLRIVNWIKWSLGGLVLPPACVQSLAVQARWLARRLEIHLLGNHLFANAKALVFAGLYFDGLEADAWLATGCRILAQELPEQVLADGGQFERSPMYHALALEDLLDLCAVSDAYADALPASRHPDVAAWRARVAPMRSWLAAMCHPDGEISHFNDAAIGIAPAPAALEAYGCRLGFPATVPPALGVTRLAQSGYVRVEQSDAVTLMDVGPLGPDYLPGHAHADTLSFECSVLGQRVVVNSGTGQYGAGAERLRQRGTAAHNTVVVDGQDSSEVWSGFRVARRARPTGLAVTVVPPAEVRCAHDGYRRLPGKPVHQRSWLFDGRSIVIEDRVTGGFSSAEARFHLHPSVTIEGSGAQPDPADQVVLRLPAGQRLHLTVTGGRLRAERTTWHPEFGRRLPNVCLAIGFEGTQVRTRIAWEQPA